MSCSIDDLDSVGETLVSLPFDPFAIQNPIDQKQDELALRTNGIAKEVFPDARSLWKNPSLDAEKVTDPTQEAPSVTAAAAKTGIVRQNPGWEVLKVGLMKERIMIGDLNKINDSIEEIQNKLGKILTFNQKLTKLPAGQTAHPITDDMQEDITALKAFGIDLVSEDEKEISVEKLAMIKSDLDAIKTKLNTEMQTKFMNVQTKTQQYNSLLDSLKIVEKHLSRLLSTIIQNMKTR